MFISSSIGRTLPASLCLLLALTIAVGVATFRAPSALATNEGESCGSCSHVNAPKNNWIRNVESYNLSGNGYCDLMWEENGGKYFLVFEKCESGVKGRTWCYPIEFWGHGETERYFKEFLYNLWVRQDNFLNCE